MSKMRKILKLIKHNVLGFIAGAVVFGSLGVYAATVITASSVGYSDNASLGATNVQDAIDKLNTKADNQYFDFATAQANTTGKVFASKKGVCISRKKKVYCFKINNYDVEKDHVQQVFSDVSCSVISSDVHCYASDVDCNIYSNGYVDCYDSSDISYCRVSPDGLIDCS